MIDEIFKAKGKEVNESTTQVADTETPTIAVTKLVNQKITERLHKEQNKRQRER